MMDKKFKVIRAREVRPEPEIPVTPTVDKRTPADAQMHAEALLRVSAHKNGLTPKYGTMLADGRTLFYYPSRRNPGKHYIAVLYPDGTMSCNCPGWGPRGRCKHVEDVHDHGGSGSVKPANPPAETRILKTGRKL